MSRRKQAKPRAVVKRGIDEEAEDDTKLVLFKEDSTSDIESYSEDDLLSTEKVLDMLKAKPLDIPEPMNHYKMGENLNEDDDNNSLGSFYSDFYSTHTSSEYSPSMSEGAATPNSLLHHNRPFGHDEGDSNRLSVNNHNAKTSADNGSLDENEDDDVETNYERIESHEANENINNGILPSKTRKIERNQVKNESSKGDGIKTTLDGSYQCQFCDKSFPRLGYLKKHEQSHAEHLPFKCEYCARLFKHKRSRDRHTKLHTGDRRYRCPHCEAAFSRSDHLKIHMKTHDNQKPFQCTVCNRGYNTAAALTSHMQNHKKQAALLGSSQSLNYSPRSVRSGSSNGSIHKRKYVKNELAQVEFGKQFRGSYISCMYCTKSDFSSFEQLNMHICSMHEDIVGKEGNQLQFNNKNFHLNCEYCTMKFPSVPAMFQHMRTTHIDRLSSPNSYFVHFNRLAASGTFSPRLNHYDELKVKIEGLSPPLTRSSVIEKNDEQINPTDLSQNRKRTPSPEKELDSCKTPSAFLCNQCNASLPDFEMFRTHLKTHITEEMVNLTCFHCSLNLRDQNEYERHLVSHFLITSSEYSCSDNCKKTFTKHEDLQKHLIENHLQTMYKCLLCSEMFDTKIAIQVHFNCVHSTESKGYRCSACMATYRNENDFFDHIKSHHSNSSSIQCMFCRVVCSSELEMHFHLAAHARQFRCPSCPETFHVEFLLDRHMQLHHAQKCSNTKTNPITTETYSLPIQYNKQELVPNNNNSILDYNTLVTNKSLFIQTGSKTIHSNQHLSAKPQALMYGLGQCYFDPSKTLADMYNYHQNNKISPSFFRIQNNFNGIKNMKTKESKPVATAEKFGNSTSIYCDICERNDFRSESEVNAHRKIAHNLKTWVSLKCAYCSGKFKTRNELEHHMKTCHSSNGKHKCLICDEIFPSPAILAEHKLQHSKIGKSGKCSHCSVPISDVLEFKTHLSEHNSEGQIPVQCICCRQTLCSDFEVSLHAKFHTQSYSFKENVCALCLRALPDSSETRLCENCCKKHDITSKMHHIRLESSKSIEENKCNLCKTILPNAQKLQEHLVEHTFIGYEERGYACYICSAVFTIPTGLLGHMHEHGLDSRPYDCNFCSEKFFFRAELEHHIFKHEKCKLLNGSYEKDAQKNAILNRNEINVKIEKKSNNDEDNENEEEYIEVEKIAETNIQSDGDNN